MADSKADEDLNAPGDMKEQLEEQQGSILMSIIKQLRIGMDLSRVTLPTFILEPRSFLERMSDFFLQQELLLKAPLMDDPVDRLLAVVKWYLAGWHIKPPGVKKPYNPILGEVFYSKWESNTSGTTKMIAEQVSHHPPVSAFYFENRKSNIVFNGHIYTRSKFLGNSAACIMEGQSQLYFINRNAEEYIITMPTAYVRGVIWGTLIMEMGGKVTLACKANDLSCELEFKTKGFFGGEYNGIKGTITQKGKKLYTIGGKWDSVVTITKTGEKQSSVFYDVKSAQYEPMLVRPEEEQEEFESRRLWRNVTAALKTRDHDTTTKYKSELEDAQRARAKEHVAAGTTHQQRYFELDDQKRWRYKNMNLKPYDPSEEQAAGPAPSE